MMYKPVIILLFTACTFIRFFCFYGRYYTCLSRFCCMLNKIRNKFDVILTVHCR